MQFVCASMKLRQIFYTQIELRTFHTVWVQVGRTQCEYMFSAVLSNSLLDAVRVSQTCHQATRTLAPNEIGRHGGGLLLGSGSV
jgi:hypothetical protein